MKFTQEFKDKWIAALRSGDYKQCKMNLYDGVGFCCIGVAGKVCGMSEAELYNQEWIWDGMAGSRRVPSIIVGSDSDSNTIECLSSMNDAGTSFNTIADWIEENMEAEA